MTPCGSPKMVAFPVVVGPEQSYVRAPFGTCPDR